MFVLQAPESCLIASSTTDGGADERKAAVLLAKGGNNIHCVAHLIQLCVNDVLDRKKPSTEFDQHRGIVRKAHDLVVTINNHRAMLEAFEKKAKEEQEQRVSDADDTVRFFKTLLLDQETRWDSELMMMERMVYFDPLLVDLHRSGELNVDANSLFSRNEFDLLKGMVTVLQPVREFTKYFQVLSRPTLAYVPGYVDDLIDAVSFDRVDVGDVALSVLRSIRTFCDGLIRSIKERFQPYFEADSLALAARLFIPGRDRMAFKHFAVTGETLAVLHDNVLDDAISLASDEDRADLKLLLPGQIKLAAQRMDSFDSSVDPLVYWPRSDTFYLLLPMIKMLLAVPATSAEAERAFSSAGFTLEPRRSNLDVDNFRREHLVRRFLVSEAPNSRAAAHNRTDRCEALINKYSEK